jgi:hypothetical protein
MDKAVPFRASSSHFPRGGPDRNEDRPWSQSFLRSGLAVEVDDRFTQAVTRIAVTTTARMDFVAKLPGLDVLTR